MKLLILTQSISPVIALGRHISLLRSMQWSERPKLAILVLHCPLAIHFYGECVTIIMAAADKTLTSLTSPAPQKISR
jgi:hypothetical protein